MNSSTGTSSGPADFRFAVCIQEWRVLPQNIVVAVLLHSIHIRSPTHHYLCAGLQNNTSNVLLSVELQSDFFLF
jgi:hypothetical protein